MIVARKKRKENIAEYLLYMWQVEDLIRANGFDMRQIRENIVDRYRQPEEVREEISRWYEELADMMRSEGVMEKGHLQINRNVIIALTDLHLRLLESPGETAYRTAYYDALPNIVQLRSKSGDGEDIPEPETCFTALYGYTLLKMQGREVSKETAEAIRRITVLLSVLAGKYAEEESNREIPSKEQSI